MFLKKFSCYYFTSFNRVPNGKEILETEIDGDGFLFKKKQKIRTYIFPIKISIFWTYLDRKRDIVL